MAIAIPAGAKATQAGADHSPILMVSALILAAAVTPLLPPIEWKVRATLLAGVLIAAGFYARVQGRGLGRSAIDRPALAFLAAATLATAFSVEPLVSVFPSRFRGEGLITSIPYVAIVLAAARLGPRDVRRAVVAMLAGGALVALIALPQYYGADPLQAFGFRPAPPMVLGGPTPIELRRDAVWEGLRAHSTLANPIFLGGQTVLLLPLAASLAMQERRRAAWAHGAVAMMLYAALISSFTRSAWIAAAAGSLVLIWLQRGVPGALRRGALLAAGFLVVTALLTVTRIETTPLHRASATFDSTDYSLRQRLYTWKHTLPLIAQRPVFGWGFSTMVGQFTDIGSPEYLSVFGTEQIVLIDSPHNELLHVAYSAGLLGLAAYLWMWAAAVKGLRRRRGAGEAMGQDGCPPALGAGLAASLVGYAIWLQFGWSVIGPANAFWVILALAAAQAGGASTESADRCTVNVAGSRPTDSPSA